MTTPSVARTILVVIKRLLPSLLASDLTLTNISDKERIPARLGAVDRVAKKGPRDWKPIGSGHTIKDAGLCQPSLRRDLVGDERLEN